MPKPYAPRGMPARFMAGAPEIVRKSIIDVIRVIPPCPFDFDVIFRDVYRDEITGLDFGNDGTQGCHFFTKTRDMRAYRERNRRKRVAWLDLPAATRASILGYLTTD